ncbi:unnamed protein product [Parnassius apollo]|uniref:(apollo) hypothetical protein n=1 Tax=Parnassius apollo TaxID=110799 RepID=A0A8S3WTP8_PARAO|nr:unnamed protein product [Parnassius apollo]
MRGMQNFVNIDEAVKHVKTIADNNRCVTCDQLTSVRMRYDCGHSVCGECVEEADECLTCINSKTSKIIADAPQAQRVKNASYLLTTFQKAFNVDVYRRYRLSEKLKLEKEVFPEPVQASIKYFNKRRSSQLSSLTDKENHIPLLLPVEATDDSMNMNTRINLVQKWLETNENVQSPVRKPFADINVNSPFTSVRQRSTPIKNKSVLLENSKNDFKKKLRKRSTSNKSNSLNVKHRKSTRELLSPSFVKEHYNDNKKISNQYNTGKTPKSVEILQNVKNYYNRENDIIIDGNESTAVDKDKIAWLAVLENEKKHQSHDLDNKSDNMILQYDATKTKEIRNNEHAKPKKNVCFYKKDFLYKSCLVCLRNFQKLSLACQRLDSNDVSVTINTKSMSTSIKVSNNEITIKKNNEISMNVISKCSVATQTDGKLYNVNTTKVLPHSKIPIEKEDLQVSSQDLFKDDAIVTDNNNTRVDIENVKKLVKESVPHCIVINDSDSDVDCSGTLEVTADVHRSSDIDCGVLSSVEQTNYSQRSRGAGRRRTIDSNNSSEKENIEPNKPKKFKLEKKEMKKL